MKILILTQYFPPETGAPQNRLFELALKMKDLGAEVSILTGFPNYPKYKVFEDYKGRWYQHEVLAELSVHRSYIFAAPGKSMAKRLLNYASFTLSALWAGLFKIEKPDLIICESPPLFLGWTAVWLKRFHGARLVFNVSDLWPESAQKLGLVKNKQLLRLSTWLEEWIYQNADLISGQTQGIVANIQQRCPEKPLYWLKNGVDTIEFSGRITGRNWRHENEFSEQDLIFYFGGLIGYAQGLDCILLAAQHLQDLPNVKFVILGEGPEKERLRQLKTQLKLENVHFYPGVTKSEMADVIQSIDVGIVPLKKLDLFLGAIPSKIFEILCLKKPLLLGIEGEAKTLFIEEGKAGWAFEPEDHLALAQQVRKIVASPKILVEKGENGYRYVREHFDRNNIAQAFWQFLQQ